MFRGVSTSILLIFFKEGLFFREGGRIPIQKNHCVNNLHRKTRMLKT